MNDDLERVCGNCEAAHPSEPFQSDFAICLNAPELEPYLDDILERQDFSRCRALVKRIRFRWDQRACDDFDPIEEDGLEWSPDLTGRVIELAEEGRLTADTLRRAILEDAFERTAWSRAPMDDYVRALHAARTLEERTRALRPHRRWARNSRIRPCRTQDPTPLVVLAPPPPSSTFPKMPQGLVGSLKLLFLLLFLERFREGRIPLWIEGCSACRKEGVMGHEKGPA